MELSTSTNPHFSTKAAEGHIENTLKLPETTIEASSYLAGPLPNYSLSSVCPQCNAPTVRRACKVRCERCGFVWDCSEL
jgi:hypothetical protein